jgi:hypothetical protein
MVAPHALSEIRIQQLIQVRDLCDSVASLHKQASTAAEKRRSAARARSATSQASIAPNFGSDDFVLVARREQRMGEKLSLRWRGPKRIVGTLSDHVYEVQDLATNAVAPVHSTRIRFYQDSSLDVTADLLAQIAHKNSGYDVHSLSALRYDADASEYSVLVSWLGFEPADSTWEPLLSLHKDVPDLLAKFLAEPSDLSLAANAASTLD